MTKIAVFGDWHGNRSWAFYALDWARRQGVTKALQVGDFGLYGRDKWGESYLNRVSVCAKKMDIMLYVTDGNHEDHDYIESVPIHEDGWRHVRHNIMVAPRPHRWEWEGVSFLSIGGAPSVDRTWQQRNKNWYLAEAITPDQAQAAIDGGRADIMLGHDAPIAEGIDSKIAGNPHGFLPIDIQYANEGRKVMDKIFTSVKPQIMFAGHYHFPVDEYVFTGPSFLMEFADGTKLQSADINQSRLIVLNKDQTNASCALLDLSTLQVEIPDLFMDFNKYRYGNLGN